MLVNIISTRKWADRYQEVVFSYGLMKSFCENYIEINVLQMYCKCIAKNIARSVKLINLLTFGSEHKLHNKSLFILFLTIFYKFTNYLKKKHRI